MAPLNDQQLDQIRDERREQIKKAALKVFARRGIAGTKMSMIANEASISQGLSYRYFSSKDELFIALVQEAMEETDAAFASLEQMSGTPTEKIRELTKGMLDESNKHSFMLIQQVQTADEVPEKAKEIVEQYSSNALIDRILPIIIKGQESGEFCAGDPSELLLLYFSVISGLMLQQVDRDDNYRVWDINILMKMLTT